MSYKEVIFSDKIQEYIELHRLMYRTLNSMIFDISFIEACNKLQDMDMHSDWISCLMCLQRRIISRSARLQKIPYTARSQGLKRQRDYGFLNQALNDRRKI